MPTPEAMTAVVHAYVEAFARGDAAMVAALFADDASVEDRSEPRRVAARPRSPNFIAPAWRPVQS